MNPLQRKKTVEWKDSDEGRSSVAELKVILLNGNDKFSGEALLKIKLSSNLKAEISIHIGNIQIDLDREKLIEIY